MTTNQKVLITNKIDKALNQFTPESYDAIYVLTDSNTKTCCRPALSFPCDIPVFDCSIAPTDKNKNLASLSCVWNFLQKEKASRHSLFICLGGGMITDLGGFAAATFKRGIPFLNIPTTLLSMVDAAVGGKTGINFNDYKNEIGVFQKSIGVIINTLFLKTLSYENILSGYGEMLKHSLLKSEKMWVNHLKFDLDNLNLEQLQGMIGENIQVKQNIVEKDPYEKGIRKSLNFGHTFGHAFESFSLSKGFAQLHGYFVAWGMICELYLSCIKIGFPTEKLRQTATFIRRHYGSLPFTCHDYPSIYEFMLHDKKKQQRRH